MNDEDPFWEELEKLVAWFKGEEFEPPACDHATQSEAIHCSKCFIRHPRVIVTGQPDWKRDPLYVRLNTRGYREKVLEST